MLQYLIDDMKRKLYHIAYKILRNPLDSEEAVADTIFKTWNTREKYESPLHLKRALFIIVRNKSINLLRDRTHQPSFTASVDPDNLTPDQEKQLGYDTLSASLMEDFRHAQILDAINYLPRRRRDIFVLRRLNNISAEDIAEMKGITKETVENHVAIAAKSIREIINKRGPDVLRSIFWLIGMFFKK